MQGLVREVEAVVARESATRAVAVHLWLGALSHLSAAHLREHFAAASPRLAATRLVITTSTDLADPNADAVILESVEVGD
jgi:Zn finger protein HypA/HybF involved in hydrogenase expression